ncbi:MAG TPA: DUF3006 domain-containing protein [Firmicutes bacterium]|nr:DUF3006 domain-containing protein [Bacillota bacterium]
MKWSVDRIEGNLAVCEGPAGQMRQVPLADLPPGIREGDLLTEEGGSWTFLPEETRARREKAIRRMNALWEDQD